MIHRALRRAPTLAAFAAGLTLATGAARVQPPPAPTDPLGPDLMMAIEARNDAQVVLVLQHGAKTETRNWLGVTPLIWAAAIGNRGACAILVRHGANVHATAPYGGVIEGAVMSGSEPTVNFLLDHGAKPWNGRLDKSTALMLAAENEPAAMVRRLLTLHPDVNARDIEGMTALMRAARRGATANVRVLLAAGAAVGVMDAAGRSALSYASMNGFADTARLLLDSGARTDTADRSGQYPIELAAHYSGDADTVRLLLARMPHTPGARAAVARACRVAAARGYVACATAINPRLAARVPTAQAATESSCDAAARASLHLIESATKTFSMKADCVSCHHQGLGRLTSALATRIGYSTDAALAKGQERIILGTDIGLGDQLRGLMPHPELYKMVPAVDINDFAMAEGEQLCALNLDGGQPSDTALNLARIVASRQAADGSWGYSLPREPIESSKFRPTAFCVRALQELYRAHDPSDCAARVAHARSWLAATPARTTEDRTFRLLGLRWAGAPRSVIAGAENDLRRTQHADGGWAQFDNAASAPRGFTRSDAYATGEVLCALRLGAGVGSHDPAVARGLAYLLRTRDADGSWFVSKRAVPENNYFDMGFPHGESQYISYGATCWATMALMLAAHPRAGI